MPFGLPFRPLDLPRPLLPLLDGLPRPGFVEPGAELLEPGAELEL